PPPRLRRVAAKLKAKAEGPHYIQLETVLERLQVLNQRQAILIRLDLPPEIVADVRTAWTRRVEPVPIVAVASDALGLRKTRRGRLHIERLAHARAIQRPCGHHLEDPRPVGRRPEQIVERRHAA